MREIADNDVKNSIKGELPLITTLFKRFAIDDDTVLQALYEADDIAEMTEKYFRHFSVEPACFFSGKLLPVENKILLFR